MTDRSNFPWRRVAPTALVRSLVTPSIIVVTGALFLSWTGVARAQQPSEQIFAEPDRQLRQRLDMAKDLVERERYSEAIQVLTTVLAAPEDFLFRPRSTGKDAKTNHLARLGPYKSLKTEARRLIAGLPDQARRSYELQYGETARRRLEAALTAGDLDAVAEVPRIFPHTGASQESLMLLGYDHMNRGRFLAAAMCFEQVREATGAEVFDPTLTVMLWTCWTRSGKPTRADEVLQELRTRNPQTELELGGVRYAVFDGEFMNEDLEDALDKQQPSRQLPAIDWTVVGGDASRTAASAGGRPLLFRPRWRQRIANDAATIDAIGRARQEFSDRAVASVPAAYPLALRDLIVMRSPHRLVAVDFQTGKRLWQIQNLEQEGSSRLDPSRRAGAAASAETGVRRLVWEDRTFGMLSSDGSTIFAIERSADSSQVSRNDQEHRHQEVDPQPMPRNQLVAYDVAGSEGKRIWAVGGIRGVEPRLQDAYFLGPPLPLDGRLYGLVEQAGEIRLVVLGADGQLQWKQQLAAVSTDVVYSNNRRLTGLSPSAAENILVCPTGVGAVVAVDLTTRDLLWGYPYTRRNSSSGSMRQQMFRRRFPAQYGVVEEQPGSRSVDDGVTIAEGHVLLTPSDSNALHCLDLATGKLHWKKDHSNQRNRGDEKKQRTDLYVATVYGDQVIVVRNDGVSAIDLLSSRPREFSGVDYGPGVAPSGRGFRTGDRYYLPVGGADGGELLILDLSKQKLLDRVATGDGSIPGNLICYRGQIVSLGTEYLELYYEIEALNDRIDAKLEENPDDPWALAISAEIHAEDGDHAEAIDRLRRARIQYARLIDELPLSDRRRDEATANQLLTRQLLFNSLLATLRTDFPTHRLLVAETKPLVETAEEKIAYLRVVAEGLAQVDELAAARDAYLDLIEETREEDALVKLSAGHSVRHSNWIRARLVDLHPRLDTAAQQRLNEKLEAELATVQQGASSAKLFELLRFHSDQPATLRIRETILDKFKDDLDLSERVELLTYLVRHGKADQQGRMVARLAKLYDGAAQPLEAAYYCRQLLTKWPDQVVLDGKTGRSLVESLPVKGRTRRELGSPLSWPTGAVDLERRDNNHVVVIPVEILSHSEMYSDSLSLEFVIHRRTLKLVIRDGMGAVRWEASLQNFNNRLGQQPFLSARLVGNRLFLSVGNEIVAIDRVKKDTSRGPVAWSSSGNTLASVQSAQRSWSAHPTRNNGKSRRLPWSDGDSRHEYRLQQPRHALGPVTSGGVTHFRGRDLVSLDPNTGETRWIRHNLIRKEQVNFVDLFGDEETLIVAFRDETKQWREAGLQGQALLLRSIDGATLVESARIPTPDRRWTTRGRMILEWRSDPGRDRLVLFDPLHQRDVWTHAMTRGAKGSLVGSDQVAIMERSGRLRVIDIETGNLQFEQQLTAEPQLRGLYAFRDRDRYLVLANQRKDEAGRRFQTGGRVDSITHFTGRLYTLDRQSGEPLWAAPATLENEWLSLKQPPDLPVLVFCRMNLGSKNNMARFTLLDKRTGALAGPSIDVPMGRYGAIINGLRIEADTQEKTIDVSVNRVKYGITATFGGDPRPPQPPAQMAELDDEATVNKWLGDGLRSLGNAIRGKKKEK